MKLSKVVSTLYDMLWEANDFSKDYSDTIQTSTINGKFAGTKFIIKVDGKLYRVKVKEIK